MKSTFLGTLKRRAPSTLESILLITLKGYFLSALKRTYRLAGFKRSVALGPQTPVPYTLPVQTVRALPVQTVQAYEATFALPVQAVLTVRVSEIWLRTVCAGK